MHYRAPIQCALVVDREWYPFSYIHTHMVCTTHPSIAGGDDPANDVPKQRQSSRENSSNVNIYYFNLILGFIKQSWLMVSLPVVCDTFAIKLPQQGHKHEEMNQQEMCQRKYNQRERERE